MFVAGCLLLVAFDLWLVVCPLRIVIVVLVVGVGVGVVVVDFVVESVVVVVVVVVVSLFGCMCLWNSRVKCFAFGIATFSDAKYVRHKRWF